MVTPDRLALLGQCRDDLRRAVDRVPEAARDRRPAPDRWSAAEVLEHLARVERAVTRLLAGIASELEATPQEQRPPHPGVDPDLPGDPDAEPEPEPEDCVALLACPVCQQPLRRDRRSLACPAGHRFDLARQGYVDLLPAGHGRSRIRGDTADMIRVRRRFLQKGHYAALADAVRRAALEPGEPGVAADGRLRVRNVLDAGCGTGYYLGQLARHLSTAGQDPPCLLGLDVSRAAVRAAARDHPDAFFFVNDVKHRICVATGAIDLLLDVFAPRNPREFARVVRPGGRLVVVVPRTGHLAQLRQRVPTLGIQAGKRDRTIRSLHGPFRLAGHETLEYALELEGDDVADLLRMTPSGWHLDEPRIQEAALHPLTVTVAFDLLRFVRSPTA